MCSDEAAPGEENPATRSAPDLSIVVPVHDEEESLPSLVSEIITALEGGPSWELILVDDGSTDGSASVMEDLRTRYPNRLRLLRSRANRGQSAALGAGFAVARADLVATLDADLQNDPADIPRLVHALDHAPGGPYDAVSGVRRNRRDSWKRRVASRVANRVRNWAVKDGVRDVGCSLKVYRKRFLVQLPVFDGLHRFLPALLQMQGARITEVDVNHRPRVHGVSKYTIGGRLKRGLYDLVGVRWLQSRWIDPSAVGEIGGAEGHGGAVVERKGEGSLDGSDISRGARRGRIG